jgi:DNA-binding protein YbaB
MRETPAVATVDELVRVKVGKDLTVRSVEILDPRLDHAFRDRLQTAIAGAVNTALQRAVREVAQTIHDISEQKRAEGK